MYTHWEVERFHGICVARAQWILSYTLVINFLKVKDTEEGRAPRLLLFQVFACTCRCLLFSWRRQPQSGTRTDSEHDRNSFWNGAEVQE